MFNGWYYIADVSLVLVHTITWSHCRMLYAHIQRHLASGQTNAGTHKEKEKMLLISMVAPYFAHSLAR